MTTTPHRESTRPQERAPESTLEHWLRAGPGAFGAAWSALRCLAASSGPRAAGLLLLALVATGPLPGQRDLRGPGVVNAKPPALSSVDLEQRLDAQLPLELDFTDEHGARVSLGDYFGSKPVVLSLVYYECPMLCTLTLNGLLRALRALSFTPGTEFEVVTVSFNPLEKPALAAEKKRRYVSQVGRPSAEKGWHFLTGPPESIRRLTEAVGFKYTYDPATRQYAHATGLMVATPSGKLSRYFYGVEYPAGDLRLALIEAASGKIGNPVDRVLLYCFKYDPTTGRYAMVVMNTLRVAAVGTVGLLAALVAVFLRRERRAARAALEGSAHDGR